MDAFKRASSRRWSRPHELARARFKRDTLRELANPMGKPVGFKRGKLKFQAAKVKRNKERGRALKLERFQSLLDRLKLNAKRPK